MRYLLVPKVLTYWDFLTQPSLGFTENAAILPYINDSG